MKFDHNHYIPCLRWKQGEYQALLRLDGATKNHITPLIEIPEIGWDFEKSMNAKTIDEHLSSFAKRVKAKWEQRHFFLDLKIIDPAERMADGHHPLEFLFADLRTQNCNATPVTAIDRDDHYQRVVRKVLSDDNNGLCLRMTIEQAAKPGIKTHIDNTLAKVGATKKNCDLCLDLEAPNFIPLNGFAKLIEAIIKGLPDLKEWRTFTVLGTSFPTSMAEVQKGATIVPRQEWMLFKNLSTNLVKSGTRLPSFGDYAISHPSVLRLDMRIVKPSASIRYAIDDAWYIAKGINVRDNGFGQYQGLCSNLESSPCFQGPGFSEGDKHISGCAGGSASTGNLTTWRWVGTNHHIEKVVNDIASFFGSSSIV